MPSELTPMMQQYVRMKELHPDCILFFRLGDFYEMFNEDARLVSKELELTLTTRDRGKPADERTPMCGVPYHSADAYIARLISKGYKVAICEQMEDPSTAKGLVDRDIIRIVTPGTVISESMLEEGRNNFICSVYRAGEDVGLCFCDISTGEVWATSFAGALSGEHLYNELGRFSPREAVLSEEAYADAALLDFLVSRLECRCENGGADRYDGAAVPASLERQFKTGLEDLPSLTGSAALAAGGLLSYLYETQKTDLSHLSELKYYTSGQYMELDLTARQTLCTMLDALGVLQAEAEQDRPASEQRTIPLYRSPAAAGYAAPVFGEDYELLTVDGEVPVGAELAVRIQGDSMEPYIRDESVVYVNHDPLRPGDVGIFCVDGDMLCKQYYRDSLGTVYLFSLNRSRSDADQVFTAGSGRSLTCFGRVMLHNLPLPI